MTATSIDLDREDLYECRSNLCPIVIFHGEFSDICPHCERVGKLFRLETA